MSRAGWTQINEVFIPFIVNQSHGGVYEDESFAAGFRTGILLVHLGTMDPDNIVVDTVEPELVPQLDLIAMANNLIMTTSVRAGEWGVRCVFRKAPSRP